MKKYVVVTGGELLNKGAQAMTFVTVDEFAKRYPEYEVVLVSYCDYKRSEEEKSNYKFKIIDTPNSRTRRLLGIVPIWLAKKLCKTETDKAFVDIVKNAAVFIDISGYAIGTNWKTNKIEMFCQYIRIAKRLGVPSYIMPQSFGPFDFEGKRGKKLKSYIKHSLNYPVAVMAREEEGRELLDKNFKLKNVVRTTDLVLQNKGIDLHNIFNVVPEYEKIDIKDNSVAIIPNMKNSKFGNQEDIYTFYKKLINHLLENEKNIYFIYHAVEDLKICEDIKQKYYCEDDRVQIIKKELSCVEFGEVVKCFDFIVGSRYHSIVHSYKECVPAIILGWAVKYKELAEIFDQKKYCFDVSNSLVGDEIISVADEMLLNYEAESEKIKAGMKEIQKKNVYDYIKNI